MRTETAQRRDHLAQGAIVPEHDVELDGLPLVAGSLAVAGGSRGADDARQPGDSARARIEAVQLEPEDGLGLDPVLELGRRPDRQDPAVVDDRDPVAELVGLGHVVRRKEDGPTGDGRLPGEDQLADRAGGRDVEPQRRLVEEEDPRVVEEAAREVQLLPLAGRQR